MDRTITFETKNASPNLGGQIIMDKSITFEITEETVDSKRSYSSKKTILGPDMTHTRKMPSLIHS